MSDEQERVALAWFREYGAHSRPRTTWEWHAWAIVRAALARDVPAPADEPLGAIHLRAAVLTALVDAGHQVRDADVDEIVKRTTRLLGDGWDRLFRAVWPDISDRAGTAPTDEPPAGLPATLASVDEVAKVCELAGLTTLDEGRAWQTPDVLVTTDHDVLDNLLTGYLVYRAGNDEPMVAIQPSAPSSVLWHAIQAARSAS